jgi:hypothetical protein
MAFSTTSLAPTGLHRALLSLERTQLLAQSQLAITYDAQALGTMGFDAALGAIVVSAKAHAYLWVASLALLVGSVLFAWLAVQTGGVDGTGPDSKDVLEGRGAWTDERLEAQVVEDLRSDLLANRANLAAKGGRVQLALTLLLMALGLELAGRLS